MERAVRAGTRSTRAFGAGLAAVTSLLVSGCGEDDVCTLVAAGSVVHVDLSDRLVDPRATTRVALCHDGRCRSLGDVRGARPRRTVWLDSVDDRANPGSWAVRVVILDRTGQVLASASRPATVHVVYPNGPGCGASTVLTDWSVHLPRGGDVEGR